MPYGALQGDGQRNMPSLSGRPNMGFLWTMICGSVLRKHGHECVGWNLFSAWTSTQALQWIRQITKQVPIGFPFTARKQTQFPTDVRLFPRLLSRLWWLLFRSAALLSRGLKHFFWADGSDINREPADCRKPDLNPGRIERTAAVHKRCVPEPAPHVLSVTFPLHSCDQIHHQIKATKPKLPSDHK